MMFLLTLVATSAQLLSQPCDKTTISEKKIVKYYHGAFKMEYLEKNAKKDVVMKVEDQIITDFSIYPNPASGKITIGLNDRANYEIKLFDLLGNAILELDSRKQLKKEIDVSSMNSGIYLIVVSDIKGNKVSKKLIIH
jgi:hypothetical protein